MTPPSKMLVLKKTDWIGSSKFVEGNLIEPTNDVKSIYPITRKGRSLPQPVLFGRLFGA
jgi:hypothetical protein